MDKKLALFRSGRYEFEYEDAVFDMAEHHRLLEQTVVEVKEIRVRQAVAQDEMVTAEIESLAKWREEKAKDKVDEGTVDALLNAQSPNFYCPLHIVLIHDRSSHLQHRCSSRRQRLEDRSEGRRRITARSDSGDTRSNEVGNCGEIARRHEEGQGGETADASW